MESRSPKKHPKWNLKLPSCLTEEELHLKSKYAELRKARESLLRFQLTGKFDSESIAKPISSTKIGSTAIQSELNSKKSSDFKKSAKQQLQCAVQRKFAASSSSLGDDNEPRSINIKGKDLRDDYLRTHFNKFGDILKIKTNEYKTISVLTFKLPTSAKMAVEEMNGCTTDGGELNVSMLRRKNTCWSNLDDNSSKMLDNKSRGRSVHLFFNGSLSFEDVEEFFQGVGRVTRIYLNKKKKFGFVTFENEKQAQRAIKEMNGDLCKGIKIVISPQKFLYHDAANVCSSSDAHERERVSYDDIEM